ncbi:hypothetical protein [Streptomyces sp. MAR4 CNX-425]|uniref:hypothetical protein n=1 Tax=Streptomyces sp. MAR4 CNX-425 TaxID=3406343 RepID=UPI003B50FB6C
MLQRTAGNKRYVAGSVLVLIGAAAVVSSAWLPWYNGREGRHYQLSDVFDGISGTRAQFFGSLFLPMAVAALLALYGTLTRSRGFVLLAGVLALGITALWMLRQSQLVGGLEINTQGTGLDIGAANAVIGSALMLIGAVVWGKQHRHPLTPPAEETTSGTRLRSVSATGGPRQGGQRGQGEVEPPSDRPQEPPRAA